MTEPVVFNRGVQDPKDEVRLLSDFRVGQRCLDGFPLVEPFLLAQFQIRPQFDLKAKHTLRAVQQIRCGHSRVHGLLGEAQDPDAYLDRISASVFHSPQITPRPGGQVEITRSPTSADVPNDPLSPVIRYGVDMKTTSMTQTETGILNGAREQAANYNQILERILADCGFDAAARHTIPGREGDFAPIPSELHEAVRAHLRGIYPNGIYSHQAQAIQTSLAGNDVCLATATASGKSLVFMATAAHELLSDTQVRVLVLYPAKALIQDQLAKWNTLLSPLELKAGFIDGSIPVAQRKEILMSRRVVLMTPDVAQAWFMSNLNERAVDAFRSHLRLLVLDEAHVYDGVFGTNMAFFLRRLQAVSSPLRLICSTATLGQPGHFIEQLTGRTVLEIGAAHDGARVARKDILLVRKPVSDAFDATANLLRQLAREFPGRFLAFGDSRKLVEVITAASQRQESEAAPQESQSADARVLADPGNGILPYRAGYEAQDRRDIQDALTQGRLRGVVATSAMEMGLDIGEIDLVLLLDTPPSMKSFWQRVGRAGRRNPGTCVIIDSRHAIADGDEALAGYLARPIEPNWLYLHNRYAQYTNALCAAAEIAQINGDYARNHFDSLPGQFVQLLDNELNPTTSVAPDLYPLKQAAQANPHHEFPLRNGIEKNFRILTAQGESRGDVVFSQALREAYPGAVYYYMATPYRVQRLNYRDGEISVHRERRYTTKPMRFAMVFPDFGPGVLRLQHSNTGLVAEAEMQVSERVTGFKEKRGNTETSHTYGPGSPYSQLVATVGVDVRDSRKSVAQLTIGFDSAVEDVSVVHIKSTGGGIKHIYLACVIVFSVLGMWNAESQILQAIAVKVANPIKGSHSYFPGGGTDGHPCVQRFQVLHDWPWKQPNGRPVVRQQVQIAVHVHIHQGHLRIHPAHTVDTPAIVSRAAQALERSKSDRKPLATSLCPVHSSNEIIQSIAIEISHASGVQHSRLSKVAGVGVTHLQRAAPLSLEEIDTRISSQIAVLFLYKNGPSLRKTVAGANRCYPRLCVWCSPVGGKFRIARPVYQKRTCRAAHSCKHFPLTIFVAVRDKNCLRRSKVCNNQRGWRA